MGGMSAVSGERRHQRPDNAGGGASPETEPLPCPRCESTNTKFCYYNNYNLSQPRYFCKSCRRYWTQGGTLRNIPVGGGSRRNAKRCRTSASEDTKPSINSTGTTTSALTFNNKADSEVFFNGSFTSLLNSQGGCGSFSSSSSYSSGFWGVNVGHDQLGLGLGLGLEEMGLMGQRRGVWPWMEFGGQIGSCGVDGSFVDGVDCISWPELAVSASTEGGLN